MEREIKITQWQVERGVAIPCNPFKPWEISLNDFEVFVKIHTYTTDSPNGYWNCNEFDQVEQRSFLPFKRKNCTLEALKTELDMLVGSAAFMDDPLKFKNVMLSVERFLMRRTHLYQLIRDHTLKDKDLETTKSEIKYLNDHIKALLIL